MRSPGPRVLLVLRKGKLIILDSVYCKVRVIDFSFLQGGARQNMPSGSFRHPSSSTEYEGVLPQQGNLEIPGYGSLPSYTPVPVKEGPSAHTQGAEFGDVAATAAPADGAGRSRTAPLSDPTTMVNRGHSGRWWCAGELRSPSPAPTHGPLPMSSNFVDPVT
jgi:hypothetical protein